jgi:uncharacterized membrane protein YoaK (UPF0700 family)
VVPPDDPAASGAPSERQLHYLAVSLAALAGFVDAIGFLQLGGIFVSFISGNSTKLAVSVVKASGAALLTGAVIAAFFLGAVAGSWLSRAAPARRKPLVLLAVSCCLLVAALLQATHWDLPAVLAMAAAMGGANTVFRREDGPYNVGITYMTGNLVRLADGVVGLFTGRRRPWLPYLLLWAGLLIGASAGAAAYRAMGMAALWIAAAAAAFLALAARRVRSPPIEGGAPSGG